MTTQATTRYLSTVNGIIHTYCEQCAPDGAYVESVTFSTHGVTCDACGTTIRPADASPAKQSA